ncbi:MAG TPA: DUF2231 domain-containing protein [Pyrinomonadaceae bacterium]|nr:DUF2231 domain-containing protein [Pyrinomonadaceae bacterium]
MASKASIMGHPVHPMLIPFPLALWVFSFISDVLYLLLDDGLWLVVAKYTLAGGIIGGLLAAVPGLIDWLALKSKEVKRIADWHARLNIIALLIFAASLYLRTRYGRPLVNSSLTIPILLSGLGVILISVSGWLGGSLSYDHGVGVKPQHDSPEEEAAKLRFS